MFRKLTNLLRPAARRAGLDKVTTATKTCQTFNAVLASVVGPGATNKCEALYFRRGVLTVDVPSSAWASELSLRSEEILSAMRKTLGQETPRQIRFIVGQAKSSQDGPPVGQIR